MKEFKKLNIYVRLVIIAIVIVILFIIGRKLYTSYKKNKAQKLLENSIETGNVVSGGEVVPITLNLGTVANEIYDAFYRNDWFGASEDEEKAVVVLSGVPKSLIPNLSELYFTLYGHNLKNDFMEFCDSTQYNLIRSKFE